VYSKNTADEILANVNEFFESLLETPKTEEPSTSALFS
jgi:hypothetical protein